MFRVTLCQYNIHFRSPKQINPLSQIRSGPHWWTDPDRMLRHKVLQFTLGLDTLPIRRVAIIRAERKKLKGTPQIELSPIVDPTGYRRQRIGQMSLWYRRCQYQEFWLQHLYTRYVWGKTGYYPGHGGKIPGYSEGGVWGYDMGSYKSRYTREPLPAEAQLIYERRK